MYVEVVEVLVLVLVLAGLVLVLVLVLVGQVLVLVLEGLVLVLVLAGPVLISLDYPRQHIQYSLQFAEIRFRQAYEKRVAVVEPRVY